MIGIIIMIVATLVGCSKLNTINDLSNLSSSDIVTYEGIVKTQVTWLVVGYIISTIEWMVY